MSPGGAMPLAEIHRGADGRLTAPEITRPRPLDPRRGLPAPSRGIWRYAEAFPFDMPRTPISLGEGATRLEYYSSASLPAGCWFLREDLGPTGSWSDRASALLVSALVQRGVCEVVDASTGNGALSAARYAREARIGVHAFMPTRSSDPRKVLVRSAGARVIEVPGPHSAATAAAAAAARNGCFHLARGRQPLQAHAAATIAYSIVEQLGHAPGAVLAPIGGGSLLAGLHLGFASIARAGVGDPPRLIGVQSERCCPVVSPSLSASPEFDAKALADSAQIDDPGRGAEARSAAEETGGAVVAVDELALDRALRELWLGGRAVEPTAALGFAFLLDEGVQQALREAGDVVVLLTGHGLRDGLAVCRA